MVGSLELASRSMVVVLAVEGCGAYSFCRQAVCVSCLSECCHGACFLGYSLPLLGLCFSFAKVRQTDIGKYLDVIAAKKFRHAFLLFREFTEKIGFSGFFLAIPCLCSPSLCFVFLHRKNYRARKASSFTF